MEYEPLRNIEWQEYGQTVVHPLALMVLGAMLVWLMVSRSDRALIPFLVVGTLLTPMQRIVVGGLDFSMIRILMLGGVARAVIRGKSPRFRWRTMDTLVIVYLALGTLAYVLLRQTSGALVWRLGIAFETALGYLLVRAFLHKHSQFSILTRALAVMAAILAAAMIMEQVTGRNLFSVFGGVPEFTRIREGRLRAQGAFNHAIMAGTFGAAFLPLYWALWNTGTKQNRRFALVGAISALVITGASSSSGPVLTLFAAIFAIAMYNYRHHVRTIILLAIATLIGLGFVMDAPVWSLIARIDIVGGSTGYHRFALIDQTIRRFREWALIGVLSTGHWGWGLNDVTNMYVLEAVNGGLGQLVLFLAILFGSFGAVGKSVSHAPDERTRRVCWSVGAVFFAHAVSFVGSSYFGQMFYFWVMSIGIAASLPHLTQDLVQGPGRLFPRGSGTRPSSVGDTTPIHRPGESTTKRSPFSY